MARSFWKDLSEFWDALDAWEWQQLGGNLMKTGATTF